MIINTETLKDLCTKLLWAVDSSELSVITETLELKTSGTVLNLSVTNKEYFVSVKFDMATPIDFHATVNADLFLKLVANTTTENIEFTIDDNSLIIRGNGTYRLPLIYDGTKLLELPEIKIDNATANFDIDGDILTSILNYNNKELDKGTSVNEIQKLFYLDEQGCITFTSGACINNFSLAQPIKLLLNRKLVKLFKLFKNSKVKFTLGYDALSNSVIQTKVRFEDDTTSLTAILSCDNTMLNKFPVSAIRGLLSNAKPYSVSVNKATLVQSLTRLLLFHTEKKQKAYGQLDFTPTGLVVRGDGKNSEEIKYDSGSMSTTYTTYVVLDDLKATLESCNEQLVPISFGDNQSLIIARGNIYNMIPEAQAMSN